MEGSDPVSEVKGLSVKAKQNETLKLRIESVEGGELAYKAAILEELENPDIFA